MKSYIYSCILAAIGVVIVPLTISGIIIFDDQNREAPLADLITGGFICYIYVSTVIALIYAFLIRKKKLKGKWWSNLGLFVLNIILLPIAMLIISLSLNGADISGTSSGGASKIGGHTSYALVLIVIAFAFGLITPKKKIQPAGGGND